MHPERNPFGEGNGTKECSEPNHDSKSHVFCRYGIHAGWFPVRGMRLEDARRMLAPLLNIDPKAVAVVNGRIVEDDFVIEGDIELLSFIKFSSTMGGEYDRYDA